MTVRSDDRDRDDDADRADRAVLDVRIAELAAGIAALGRWGWRRIDVERAVAVNGTAVQAELVAALDPAAVGAVGAVDQWLARHRLTAVQALAAVSAIGTMLRRFGSIPGVDDDQSAAGDAGVDPAVLAKVRALLAKAESTTFDAEADALMAKAHQLMVRHAIDQVVLEGRSSAGSEPGDVHGVTARRVFIDDPYQRAKYLLLAEVARASACRALLSTGFGMATVFGHATDLEAVELLYTSLLLQATAGVVSARPGGNRGHAPSQVAAFRRAWLVAFAQRIGERLRVASAATVQEAAAELGQGLLPVLAAREDAVEAKLREAAPNVRTLRTTVSSRAGWQAGAAAGDRASIGTGPTLPRRPGALGPGSLP